MQTSFRRLLAASLVAAAVCIPRQLTYGCGPDLEADQTRFALFDASISGLSSLEPFYYTERFLNTYIPDPEGLDYERNCAEWVRYCKGGVSAHDVYIVQYETKPDEFLYAAKTWNWGALADNSFIRYLMQRGHRHVLEYMKLAKQGEANIYNASSDPWHTDAKVNDAVSTTGLADDAAQRCIETSDSFLRTRYAFQAVKLWYYSGGPASFDGDQPQPHMYADSILHYAANYLQNRQSVVCAWANLYVGMSVADRVERNYYLVCAFDQSEEKKVFAFQHLGPDDLDLLAHSKYATATDEAVSAIRIMKDPGRSLRQIRSLIAAHPDSKYTPMLLAREVNKLEAWLWTPEILRFYPSSQSNWDGSSHTATLPDGSRVDTTYAYFLTKNYRKDRLYLKEVITLLTQMVGASRGQRPFYALALAHLCNMERDYKSARKYARTAVAGIKPGDTLMRTQQIVELAIADAYAPDIKTAAAKERIASYINELLKLGQRFVTAGAEDYYDAGAEHKLKSSAALSQFALLLSRRYQELGDVVTAALLFNKSGTLSNEYASGNTGNYGSDSVVVRYNALIGYLDRRASPADIDALIRFTRKEKKTAFEELISPTDAWAYQDFYLDLKGTLLFRDARYTDAAKVFGQVNPDFWAKEYEFHNYLPKKRIWHLGTLLPNELPDSAADYEVTSKYLIAKDMARLQAQLSQAKNAGQRSVAAFRLAAAQYQITYWGKAWMMFSYGNSSYELELPEDDQYKWAWFTFERVGKKYARRYYQCADAIENFRLALRSAIAAGDRESAARSMLMLAYCDQIAYTRAGAKRQYPKGIRVWNDDQKPYQSPYLYTFVHSYGSTRTFELAETECPDITSESEK